MQKEIPLYEAMHLLRSCPAVILEGRLLEPNILDLDDEEDWNSEFMYLQWEEEAPTEWDDETDEVLETQNVICEAVFKVGDNQKCLLDGCILTMVSDQGEEELTLLREYFPDVK